MDDKDNSLLNLMRALKQQCDDFHRENGQPPADYKFGDDPRVAEFMKQSHMECVCSETSTRNCPVHAP